METTLIARVSGTSACDMTLSCGMARRRKRERSTRKGGRHEQEPVSRTAPAFRRDSCAYTSCSASCGSITAVHLRCLQSIRSTPDRAPSPAFRFPGNICWTMARPRAMRTCAVSSIGSWARAAGRQRLDDRAHIADMDLLLEQVLQTSAPSRASAAWGRDLR